MKVRVALSIIMDVLWIGSDDAKLRVFDTRVAAMHLGNERGMTREFSEAMVI